MKAVAVKGWPKDRGVVLSHLKAAKLFCIRDCVRALKTNPETDAKATRKNPVLLLAAEEKESLLGALKKLNATALWQLYTEWLTGSAAQNALVSINMKRHTEKILRKNSLIKEEKKPDFEDPATLWQEPKSPRAQKPKSKRPKPDTATRSSRKSNDEPRPTRPERSPKVSSEGTETKPEKTKLNVSKNDMPADVHPSWAAKLQQKAKLLEVSAAPASKHLTFD